MLKSAMTTTFPLPDTSCVEEAPALAEKQQRISRNSAKTSKQKIIEAPKIFLFGLNNFRPILAI
jgi:hypothetical protein